MTEQLSSVQTGPLRNAVGATLSRGHRLSGILAPLLCFLILPTALLGYLQSANWMEVIIIAMIFLSVLFSFIALRMFLLLISSRRLLGVIYTTIFSLYYIALYLLLGFWLYVGEKFDPYFAFDSADQALMVAAKFMGNFHTILIILVLVIVWIGFIFLARKMNKILIDNFFFPSPKKIFAIPALLLCLTVLFPSHLQVIEQITSAQSTKRAREVTMTIFPDNSHYSAKNDESVFILQLDSQNALALNNILKVNGKSYEGEFMPQEKRIAQDGVYFPFFWANAVQTARAQETLLCGIANNLGRANSYDPSGIKNMCLPAILKKNDYRTVMFRSDGLDISNTKNFMESIGFDKVLGQEVMKENDPKYSFGYDDCVFYKRAFEYLKSTEADPSKKLFAYFEVSTNHAAFAPRGQTFAHAYKPASNFVEQYINSALEQDYWVGEFYKDFREYTGGKAHLIITSDTSWPLGVNGSTFNEVGAHTDDFAIPVTYIPPTSRAKEFRVGEGVSQRFDQTDIIPTIMELLSGKNVGNSFVPFMKKATNLSLRNSLYLGDHGERYEDCHLLTQPYNGGKIVIVKGDDYHLYQIDTQTLLYYNLKEDFLEQNPTILEENLPYDAFMNQYLCERYRDGK